MKYPTVFLLLATITGPAVIGLKAQTTGVPVQLAVGEGTLEGREAPDGVRSFKGPYDKPATPENFAAAVKKLYGPKAEKILEL